MEQANVTHEMVIGSVSRKDDQELESYDGLMSFKSNMSYLFILIHIKVQSSVWDLSKKSILRA